MLQKIQHYMAVHRLPQTPSSLLVALSGGADSVALLLILKELGYSLTALHCNFHLRGKESDRDENFVRKLCEQQQIQLLVEHFDTTGYAQQKGISIEMAARELRYNWFEIVRQSTRATAIAVAHHSDDNAETLLLNLVRGSGIHGLKGMLPQQGHIIRPLLCLRRKELETFLESHHQQYVTDSTNFETVYKRNKIRHLILPQLRELNPAIDEGLALTATRLSEAELLYNYAVEHLRNVICTPLTDGIIIHLDRLRKEKAAMTLLHEYLRSYNFTPAEISTIGQQLERQTGTHFSSPTHLAVFHQGDLEVRRIPTPISPLPLPTKGEILLPDGRKLQIEMMQREQLCQIPKQSDQVTLDADCLKGNLTLRTVCEGDRFHPFGMKGSKLVSDYLTDRHRSLIDKKKALAICDKQGIVWLVQERVDQRAAVTEHTLNVIRLTIKDK